MPLGKAVNIIKKMTSSQASRIFEQTSSERVARILERTNLERAAEIVERLSTEKAVNAILAMDRTVSASLILEINADVATQIIEKSLNLCVARIAEIIEQAASINLEVTISILERTDTKALAELLVEISRLPEKVETPLL